MNKQILTASSLAFMSAALLAGPASGEEMKVKRLEANPKVTLKQKLGYWVECSYTAVGQDCHYVYMKPKGSAKLERIKVKDSKLKRKGDYYLECRYTGLGEECYYVYAKVKPKT